MTEQAQQGWINKPTRPVGIVGYGAYIPRYRLPGTEISRIWKGDSHPGPSKKKLWRVWMKM